MLCALTLLSSQSFTRYAWSQSGIDPVALERQCIPEGQPRGLSLVVDDQRVAHMVYFTSLGQLAYLRLSDLEAGFQSQRLVLDFLTPEPAHTRMTLTDQGIAFCYYDPRIESVIVIEQSGETLTASIVIDTPNATYCDITSDGQKLWLSAVIGGQLNVAEGLNIGIGDTVERNWSVSVAVNEQAIGHSAIAISDQFLWAASSMTNGRLALASRPLNSSTWTLEEINAPNQLTVGDQLRLSPRSGPFSGSVWATHTPPADNRATQSDLGFLITEIFDGTWGSYNPVADYTGGYHDAFAGPARGDQEGYLYAVTREHRRNPVFGNTDALILLRYVSVTSNANRQVIEGPFAGSGTVYTELGIAPDPLAEVVIVGHFYDGDEGQLCRWSAPDQDQDGLPDAYEPIIGTRIDQADTDVDGMSDGYETLVSGTDPLIPDLPPPRCDDELHNGEETDVDCGGGECPPCGFGQGCAQDQRDCAQDGLELVCLEGTCAQSSCEDGRHNQDETDIDCGGARCAPCLDGLRCLVDRDCVESSCIAGICLNPDCTDETLNQDETDVDCGGAVCAPCQEGQRCTLETDCLNAECIIGRCVVPTCTDERRNQDETDVDCGGASCEPCPRGGSCVADTDCAIGQCITGVCLISSCEDGRRNQDESDIDCGGSTCEPCLAGARCDRDSDCLDQQCLRNTCVTPSCQDGVLNRGESDIDCGGASCARCLPGRQCEVNADCLSRICLISELGQVCSTSSCVDGTQNAHETDVDCGGGECSTCIAGRVCAQDADCESGRCRGQRCQDPRCDDQLRNGDETDEDCGGRCLACEDGLLCDADQDCTSVHCLGGRCAPPSCMDARLNQGEVEIDCGGPCSPCVIIEVDRGYDEPDQSPIDMHLTDMNIISPDVGSDEPIDMSGDDIMDMGALPDLQPEIDREIIDPLPIDGGVRPADQSMTESDQDPYLHIDQSTGSSMPDPDGVPQVDLGQGGPAPFDPEASYDPQVFRRDRPERGCQAGTPSFTGRAHSHLLLLWLLICYALIRRSLTWRGSV